MQITSSSGCGEKHKAFFLNLADSVNEIEDLDLKLFSVQNDSSFGYYYKGFFNLEIMALFKFYTSP